MQTWPVALRQGRQVVRMGRFRARIQRRVPVTWHSVQSSNVGSPSYMFAGMPLNHCSPCTPVLLCPAVLAPIFRPTLTLHQRRSALWKGRGPLRRESTASSTLPGHRSRNNIASCFQSRECTGTMPSTSPLKMRMARSRLSSSLYLGSMLDSRSALRTHPNTPACQGSQASELP